MTLLLQSQKTFAWGSSGHRIVGELAESQLNKKTKKILSEILGAESLADASIWADEIRSRKSKSAEIARRWAPIPVSEFNEHDQARIITFWHFVTIPENSTYPTSPKEKNGDVIWAINKMIAVIKDKSQPLPERKEAIRLLAHYIGDIHQPLHVGTGFDRGANNCWVNWFPEYPKNIKPAQNQNDKIVNLHSVWDSELIDQTKLSYTEYAKFLEKPNARHFDLFDDQKFEKATPIELEHEHYKLLTKWKTLQPEEMANESKSLRAVVYTQSDNNFKPSYCFENFSKTIQKKNIPTFSYEEYDQFVRIVNIRLLQAGTRLAYILNSILN